MSSAWVQVDRTVPRIASTRRVLSKTVPVVLLGLILGASFAAKSQWADLRLVVAALIVLAFALLSSVNIGAAIAGVFMVLPFIGLIRRMLIPISPWTSYDPLLLVAPALSTVFVFQLLRTRKWRFDLVSGSVLIFLVLAFAEVANPASGGVQSGLTGLLFLAAPLVWFFVGQSLVDQRTIKVILASVIGVGLVVAAYGLLQLLVGLPSWDQAWIDVGGYTALTISGVVRPFGSFPSAAEYASYLGIGVVICFAGIRRQSVIGLLALPLLALAVFLDSSRGIVVLVAVVLLVVLGLRTGRLSLTLASLMTGAALAITAVSLFGDQLILSATNSGNPLVAHQVGGLVRPLSPDQSTLSIHAAMVVNGFATIGQHPLGLGTAATNLAGVKGDAQTAGTEFDLTDAFVSLGIPGGVLFTLMLVTLLSRAVRIALRVRRWDLLASAGVLLLMSDNWLNGGFYAVAPLVWVIAGYVNSCWLQRRVEMQHPDRFAVVTTN